VVAAGTHGRVDSADPVYVRDSTHDDDGTGSFFFSCMHSQWGRRRKVAKLVILMAQVMNAGAVQ
jgi:hypothetical protein